MEQFQQVAVLHPAASAFLNGLVQIGFDFLLMFLHHQGPVQSGYIGALAMNSNRKSFSLQIIVRFLDCQSGYFQFLG